MERLGLKPRPFEAAKNTGFGPEVRFLVVRVHLPNQRAQKLDGRPSTCLWVDCECLLVAGPAAGPGVVGKHHFTQRSGGIVTRVYTVVDPPP